MPSLETLAAQTVLGLRNAEHAADLRHQAFHDSLTGLANRLMLRDHLEQAVERARRGSPVALLLIDLDGFKGVNDTYGHAAGDQLLVAVAQRLRDGIRGADTAARLGGDEFAVLLPGSNHGGASALALRLRAAIEAIEVDGGTLRVSMGVAAAEHGRQEAERIVQTADRDLYQDKARRKLRAQGALCVA